MEIFYTDDLPADIIKYHLVQYLKKKDIISLLRSTLISRKLFDDIVITEILQKLQNIFKKKYPIILQILKSGACLTGSFLLSCLCDDFKTSFLLSFGEQKGPTNYGDIDICVPRENLLKIKDIIKNLKMTSSYEREYDFDSDNPKERQENFKEKIPFLDKLINIYGRYIRDETDTDTFTERREFKLQLILINNTPREYIKTFDINVCKNLLYFSEEERTFKLHIDSLDDIYMKTMQINFSRLFTYNRIFKYQRKGFKIKMNFEDEVKLMKYMIDQDHLGNNPDPKYHKFEIFVNKCLITSNTIEIPCNDKRCILEEYFHKKYKHYHIINLDKLDEDQIMYVNKNPDEYLYWSDVSIDLVGSF